MRLVPRRTMLSRTVAASASSAIANRAVQRTQQRQSQRPSKSKGKGKGKGTSSGKQAPVAVASTTSTDDEAGGWEVVSTGKGAALSHNTGPAAAAPVDSVRLSFSDAVTGYVRTSCSTSELQQAMEQAVQPSPTTKATVHEIIGRGARTVSLTQGLLTSVMQENDFIEGAMTVDVVECPAKISRLIASSWIPAAFVEDGPLGVTFFASHEGAAVRIHKLAVGGQAETIGLQEGLFLEAVQPYGCPMMQLAGRRRWENVVPLLTMPERPLLLWFSNPAINPNPLLAPPPTAHAVGQPQPYEARPRTSASGSGGDVARGGGGFSQEEIPVQWQLAETIAAPLLVVLGEAVQIYAELPEEEGVPPPSTTTCTGGHTALPSSSTAVALLPTPATPTPPISSQPPETPEEPKNAPLSEGSSSLVAGTTVRALAVSTRADGQSFVRHNRGWSSLCGAKGQVYHMVDWGDPLSLLATIKVPASY